MLFTKKMIFFSEKKPDVSGKMTMIELENERLHKELMLLQEQNFLTQNRRKSDREGRDNKYKGHGHSDHRGEGHSYYKHLNCDKLENKSYSSKPKVYGKNVTKGSDITENDYHNKVYKMDEKYVKTNPVVVPPLDLSSITGQKTETNVLAKIHPQHKNFVTIPATYTFMAKRKDKSRPSFQHSHGNQEYRYKNVLPDRNLRKISELRDYHGKEEKVGRSRSFYVPRKKPKNGSHKVSIRSEIIGGVKDSGIYPMKHQMAKGDYSDPDLVGVIRTTQPHQGRTNVTFDYYGPNKDIKYETVTIKQREELNPDNNHVIHTTTYKEEKLNGSVT